MDTRTNTDREIYLIISCLNKCLHCSWGLLSSCFWKTELLCPHLWFISLEKGGKSLVKLAFIRTFIDCGANYILSYFMRFLRISFLLYLTEFVGTWLETIFSCIKFVRHIHFSYMVRRQWFIWSCRFVNQWTVCSWQVGKLSPLFCKGGAHKEPPLFFAGGRTPNGPAVAPSGFGLLWQGIAWVPMGYSSILLISPSPAVQKDATWEETWSEEGQSW